MDVSNFQFMAVAESIGRVLCRDAVWDNQRCTWLGWSKESYNHKLQSTYRAVASDLYAGTAGIALFLAELNQFADDKQIARATHGAVKQMLSTLDMMVPQQRHGFYTGHIGIAYSLIRIGELIERPDYIEQGLALIQCLRALPLDATLLDVVSGSAGAIPVLLKLASAHGRPELKEMALMHGEQLLRTAVISENAYSWQSVQTPVKQNLTGHSHGVAGIVSALLELYQVTQEQSFLQAAQMGLEYENHLFNQKEGNWPDLRVMPQRPIDVQEHFFMAWCHGAPGIGLSRLRNVEILPDNVEIARDLEAALQTTAATLATPWKPGSGNYSLCHGATGNAELMMMAGQKLQRPALTAVAEKVGQEGIEYYVKQGLPWPCGNNGAGEAPGLMLGLAGIGHFYLRLFDPVQVPSVLIITP